MTLLLWTFAIVLVAIGLVGIVLPALPGTILIFLGLLLGAWADHFERVGWMMLVVIGVIGAASYGVDFVAAALGAKHLGASRRAMAGDRCVNRPCPGRPTSSTVSTTRGSASS